MSREQNLRNNRLVFYENDVHRLDGELDTFLELSSARCALLIDKEGHLVTRRGEAVGTSMEAIAALVAGSFAATKEMARLLGESEFTVMFHQGARDSIQLQLVGNRTLLAVLFDERTNMGLVRFYAQEASQHIAVILGEIENRPQSEDQGLSKNFSADASAALENLF
jgi:predicted regulator of Ras-like GTPase activity (Roadblock/LC7/MglB family)